MDRGQLCRSSIPLFFLCAASAVLTVGPVFDAQAASRGASPFIHWESPHVSPLAMTPNGDRLLAVNTADHKLEVFDLSQGLAHVASIPVGLAPVSVRARTNQEAWVVNRVSDSVSVVDLAGGYVVDTLRTGDEPADVVFAGNPQRAFVSVSLEDRLEVFDPADRTAAAVLVSLEGEHPRALATDGTRVYVAMFESGNGSTVLAGAAKTDRFPPNAVNDPDGPHGGVNPPPNDGNAFDPPLHPDNPAPPPTALIVRRSSGGQWLDDTDADWTAMISGADAAKSGRPVGWTLTDHDVAVVSTGTLTVQYLDRMLTTVSALAVHPTDQRVTAVGQEALNQIRFEPKLRSHFVRALVAFGLVGGSPSAVDLNPHLTYTVPTIPSSQRALSVGDPRAVAWTADGLKAYVAGMGSNNLAILDAAGDRVDGTSLIDVGQGPTGLVVDTVRNRLYVMERFAGTIGIVDLATDTRVGSAPFFDPTPTAVQQGRPMLYDSHRTSGLGQVSCASCHIDARTDGLAWDLGDPSAPMKSFDAFCIFGNTCEDWHPMKGPMLTQSLQDIIGQEPFHWRGDRFGIEEFAGTYQNLQGTEADATEQEMQDLERFLETIYYPPNPYRNDDNTLRTTVPLPGHFTTGRFGAAGLPLGTGNAVTGHQLFSTGGGGFNTPCQGCHLVPTGTGPLQSSTPGPHGEMRHAILDNNSGGLINFSDVTQVKFTHLRDLYARIGFNLTQTTNSRGFGYLHDGTLDSLERYASGPGEVWDFSTDQQVADVVAFLLSFSGSDLSPEGSTTDPHEFSRGRDTHAGVGRQWTVHGGNQSSAETTAFLNLFVAQAGAGKVGLIAKSRQGGVVRGYYLSSGQTLQSDRSSETLSVADLRQASGSGSETTFLVVPKGVEARLGVDRDEDGFFDRDELDAGSDPADPGSTPGGDTIFGDGFETGNTASWSSTVP